MYLTNNLYFWHRIRVEENGNLVITKLVTSDQGRYVCLAQNIVGIRETPQVQLTVNGKCQSLLTNNYF